MTSAAMWAAVLLSAGASAAAPAPGPWPAQFHATLLQNRSNALAFVDLYYDYPNGRNYNLIRPQLNDTAVLYDLEYRNGSTYYYKPNEPSCFALDMGVGLLRPDWLDGGKYLGDATVDNLPVNVYNVSDMGGGTYFITYYNDARRNVPVKWRFFDGAEFTVLSFTPGVASTAIDIPVACPFRPKPQPPVAAGAGGAPASRLTGAALAAVAGI